MIRWDNEFESTSKSTHKGSDRYKVFLVFLLLIALQLPFLRRRNILFLLTISLIFSTLYPPCGAVWQQPLALCILSSKTRLLDLEEWQSGAWSRGFWVHSYQLLLFSSLGIRASCHSSPRFAGPSPLTQWQLGVGTRHLDCGVRDACILILGLSLPCCESRSETSHISEPQFSHL